MSNIPIMARLRRRSRLAWMPFVMAQRYERGRVRPSATDPDIDVTDVIGGNVMPVDRAGQGAWSGQTAGLLIRRPRPARRPARRPKTRLATTASGAVTHST